MSKHEFDPELKLKIVSEAKRAKSLDTEGPDGVKRHMFKWKLQAEIVGDASSTKEKDRQKFENHIKSITYQLHESFDNPMRKCTAKPWVVEETGYGEFDIRIVIDYANGQADDFIFEKLLFPKKGEKKRKENQHHKPVNHVAAQASKKEKGGAKPCKKRKAETPAQYGSPNPSAKRANVKTPKPAASDNTPKGTPLKGTPKGTPKLGRKPSKAQIEATEKQIKTLLGIEAQKRVTDLQTRLQEELTPAQAVAIEEVLEKHDIKATHKSSGDSKFELLSFEMHGMAASCLDDLNALLPADKRVAVPPS